MSQSRGGYRQSVNGLVGALIAVFVCIAFVWGLSRFQHRDPPNPVPTVDFTAALAQARRESPFHVLAPQPVPVGWRADSVEWQGAGPQVSWHLGFLTPQGQYVGLEQSNALPRDFVPAKTPANRPGNSVTIHHQQWQTLTSANGNETALLYAGNNVTTIVTGTAPLSQLTAFAVSLK
ncbi:MAG: DUF4245 domain-containing protein [Nocardioidaceae bacterium]